MNREYEIGLIINPEATEEEAEKIKSSITDILVKGKGTIGNIDDWGRKAFAYPIEKHNEGIYVFIKTLSPGEVIALVERRLKLNEKVMRFIIIRLDDKLKKTNKLEKKWKRIEKFSKKPAIEAEVESDIDSGDDSDEFSPADEPVKEKTPSEKPEVKETVADEVNEAAADSDEEKEAPPVKAKVKKTVAGTDESLKEEDEDAENN